MDLENSVFWIWWKRYGEHIIAPLVLILLILIWYQYFHSNQLQEEINLNCGWGEENYHCFCQKSDVIKLENAFGNPEISISNFSVGD